MTWLILLAIVLLLIVIVCLAEAAPHEEWGGKPRAGTAIVSWYGADYDGRKMANGKPFNHRTDSVASNHFPLGSEIEFEYRGRRVIARVSDRGPDRKLGRDFDFSEALFARLTDNHTEFGIITVRYYIINP